MRIVSLLPSATEIVYALGYGEDVVGVSHECDFPPEVAKVPRMIEPVFENTQLNSERISAIVIDHLTRGESLYKVRIEELKKADPDLIITQELCDVCAVGSADVLAAVNQLCKPVSVLSLNPHSLKDVKDDIRSVAKILGATKNADKLIIELEAKVDRIRRLTEESYRPRVFCVEWLKPLMNAGHWVPEMVEYAGGTESLASRGQLSRCIDWDSVVKYDPEVIILMPCGYMTGKTLDEVKRVFEFNKIEGVSALHNGKVFATDGHNYFSRSGPRLFDAVEILAQLIHPELFPQPLNSQLGTRVELPTAESVQLR